jgi:phosphatidylserine decarboxylase
MARRIVWYVKEGEKVEQGAQFGFIKFGSRVDVFVPLGTKINVGLGEVVKGGRTVLATLVEPVKVKEEPVAVEEVTTTPRVKVTRRKA